MVAATFTLAAITLRVMADGSTPIEAARRSLNSAASKVSTVPANVSTRSTSVSNVPPGVSGGGGLGEGGEGGGGDGGDGGGGGGGEGGSEGGEGYAVIAMVLIMLHSADHSPANRSDCPAPMVTNCVETVNSLLIVDPDTGCMGPPLGPTVQPDDNGGASHRESPKPISTR